MSQPQAGQGLGRGLLCEPFLARLDVPGPGPVLVLVLVLVVVVLAVAPALAVVVVAVVAVVAVVVELLRLVGSVSWPVPPSPTEGPGLGVRSEGRVWTISVSDASKSYSDSVLRYCAGVSAYCIGGGGSDRGKGDVWVLMVGGWTHN